jgi:hypothetical protein
VQSFWKEGLFTLDIGLVLPSAMFEKMRALLLSLALYSMHERKSCGTQIWGCHQVLALAPTLSSKVAPQTARLGRSSKFLGSSTGWPFYDASIKLSATAVGDQEDKMTMQTPPSESVVATMDGFSFSPMFDFGSTNETVAQKSIQAFDRIDDVIMGGISSSTLQARPDLLSASWSGVVRIDGGGFCGFRTLPFVEPYNVTGQDGLYLKLRLDSDNEPNRRVWKVTVRTDTSRGELVYQAPISIPPLNVLSILPTSIVPSSAGDAQKDSMPTKTYHTVLVPFKDFNLVRGPRMVPDGPPIDTSGGLYQVGMTCSKFQMGVNTTQLENFRPGFFNLLIKDIGSYSDSLEEESANTATNMLVPQTLSKEEAKKKASVILKIIRPASKLFFTEKGNRRKSVMNILRSKRGKSSWEAFRWGVSYRAKTFGFLKGGVGQTAAIVGIDTVRFLLGSLIRYGLFLPIRTLSRGLLFIKKNVLGMKVKTLPPME